MSTGIYFQRLGKRFANEPLDLSDDPDVQRCRAERAKRKARPNPKLDEAKAALARILEREAQARRPGRKKQAATKAAKQRAASSKRARPVRARMLGENDG